MKKSLVLLFQVCMAGTAMADVVFSDDFRDGNRDGWVLVGKSGANQVSVSEGALLLSSSDTDPENNFSAVAAFQVADLRAENIFGIADGQWRHFKLLIEAVSGREGRLEHEVTLTLDEGRPTESVLSYGDGGVLLEKVDRIGLMSMKGNDFKVDNIKVIYVRP